MYHISKGLDLPITGKPESDSIESKHANTVATIGFDYHGMKPTVAVAVGDNVKLGQPIFTDKKTPGVIYTAPAGGKVIAINRGYQRALQSVVITPEDTEQEVSFTVPTLDALTADVARSILVESGLWTSLRTRPFSKVPAPESQPYALFVNAMDSNPLALNPHVVIHRKKEQYLSGLRVLSVLVDCPIHVCSAKGVELPQPDLAKMQFHQFSGKHPSGNVGTHMSLISPVGAGRVNWYLNYQDVIAIGALFTTGKLDVSRVVSLAGPQVQTPKLIETRIGADIESIASGECKDEANRIISGSVLSGRQAEGGVAWLGRYHLQVAVIREDRDRHFVHYLTPGMNRFSVLNIYISKLFGGRRFAMTSSTNGSERAMVPVGAYEKVMPLDILPTQLLRALLVKDIEAASELGCLELDEEDLALCTFVCPGKYEYGSILRDNLTLIEKEGI